MADDETYLLFAWTTSGYELREEHGALPGVGESVDSDGKSLRVYKVAPSPLPGDSRRCAYAQG
jgi:hypothetical protein